MARVCMVVFNDYAVDPRVRREAEALIERGDTVDCICPQDRKRKATSIRGVRLFGNAGKYRGANRLGHVLAYFRFFCYAFAKLAVLHVKRPYDVVQVHTMPDFLVFATLVPKLLGAKVILDIHDLMPELYMAKFGGDYRSWIVRAIIWIERKSVAFADKTIAVHGPHLDILVQHGNPREKFSVLLNVPDHRIFARPPDPRAASKGFRLIYHGTVADNDRAGLCTALRAVAIVQREIPDVQLQIIGNGAGMARLAELARELDLRSKVQFLPVVPVEQLPELLLQATIGIIPYEVDSFTRYVLPTKLLEYAALGIPAIVSRLPAVQAYFDHDMVEYFEPGNHAELATRIFDLYRNPAKASSLAAKAARFSDRYNWQQHREVYFRLIDSLSPASVHVLSNAS
jgi:glycosyltransferase involved in cell wall biosynthesis